MKIRANAAGRGYPFPLVADPGLRVYSMYGVETSWPRLLWSTAKPGFYLDWIRSMRHRFWGGVDRHMATMPADFFIGRDGRIVEAHYGRDIGDHLPIDRIHAMLGAPDQPIPSRATPTFANTRSFSEPEVPMKSLRNVILVSLLWASALIASSFFLKGFAFADWVDSLLYLGAGVWISPYVVQRRSARCG